MSILEDKTTTGGSLYFQACGLSMRPFLKDGDRVIVKKLKAQDLKIGDVILYADQVKKKTVCHRFVKRVKSENKLILFARADAGGISGEPVLEDYLIGCAVGIVRGGRIINLRSRQQAALNWFNAKFYGFFWAGYIFLKKILIYRVS